MSNEWIIQLAELVDKLNDEHEVKNDSAMFSYLSLVYCHSSTSINWLGGSLWDYDDDPGQTIKEIEAEVREALSNIYDFISSVGKSPQKGA